MSHRAVQVCGGMSWHAMASSSAAASPSWPSAQRPPCRISPRPARPRPAASRRARAALCRGPLPCGLPVQPTVSMAFGSCLLRASNTKHSSACLGVCLAPRGLRLVTPFWLPASRVLRCCCCCCCFCLCFLFPLWTATAHYDHCHSPLRPQPTTTAATGAIRNL